MDVNIRIPSGQCDDGHGAIYGRASLAASSIAILVTWIEKSKFKKVSQEGNPRFRVLKVNFFARGGLTADGSGQ
jgi:hypothetical protein